MKGEIARCAPHSLSAAGIHPIIVVLPPDESGRVYEENFSLRRGSAPVIMLLYPVTSKARAYFSTGSSPTWRPLPSLSHGEIAGCVSVFEEQVV